MPIYPTRRQILTGLAATAGAGLLRVPRAAAEPSPETTSIRLPAFPAVADCLTPEYIAEEFLRSEGFTDIRFIETGFGPDSSDWLARGEIDFDWNFPPSQVAQIDKGTPIKVLTGLHTGCLELFVRDDIRSVQDLKGRRVAFDNPGGSTHKLITIITSYIGFHPDEDFRWVPGADSAEMFIRGEVDAFLAAPPQPQMMRERGIGHVLINTTVDLPWSQYFCCMLSGTQDYVTKYPVATKRAMRALLKAVDFCVSDPEKAARASVGLGRGSRYDYTLQTLRSDARYDKWHEFDPEDTIRFYALRMQETGMIGKSPNTIVEQGTDWRFFNELKRELRA
jgi:NitT/TauT family transport system substrate-binding protein